LSFLGKHYEKIILATFLLIFILALVYLITVFSKSKETTEADLRVVRREADYKQNFNESGEEVVNDVKKAKYAVLENLGKSQTWNRSENRNPDSPAFTKLLVPFKAARCRHCEKIIPSVYFGKDGDCILCGGKLEEIIETEKPPDDNVDKDGDGMPDMFERQNELNPLDASDKMVDKDADGFPNFIEYEAKTKIDDAKSHPPIADRLYLVRIKRKKLPLQLWNVQVHSKEDKSKWLIQIKIQDKRRRWKSEFPKLGATLKLGKGMYKIIDVIYKTEEKFDKRLGAPRVTNTSEIIIQNTVKEGDKPITVRIKRNVYENLARITLKDYCTNKTYNVKVGDTFTAGDSEIGMEKYTVVSIDKTKGKTKSIIIEDEKGKKFIVPRKSALETKIDALNEADGKKTIKPGPDGFDRFDPRMENIDLPPGPKPRTKRGRFPARRF